MENSEKIELYIRWAEYSLEASLNQLGYGKVVSSTICLTMSFSNLLAAYKLLS